MPRPRTSVPTMTLTRPALKSPSARSRCRWSLSPWTDAAGRPIAHSPSTSSSAADFLFTNTTVLPGTLSSSSNVAAVLSRPSTYMTFCVTLVDAPPTRPTCSIAASTRKLSAMARTVLGKVAENIIVCRPPSAPPAGMSAPSTICRSCGSKPMSSMRSASSSTRKRTLRSETRPRSTMSFSRPGVATRTSQPRSSSRICAPKGVPPYATHTRRPVRKANFFDSSKICTASSRVGASASARMATGSSREPRWPAVPAAEPASRILLRMGSMKASVLPEPVCATEMTSIPQSAIGTECACTGVGTSKPAKRRLRARTFPQRRPAKCWTGELSGESALAPRGSSTRTGMSAYLPNSMPDARDGPKASWKAASSSSRLASKSSSPSSPCHLNGTPELSRRFSESGCHGGMPRPRR
mmetsp:Transcript_2986/g.6776  ORF Transcript_2986/g.6776 Transcript_2986/m.6776 type:complete len:411 (+) Transcript_2986:268-1500(+)